MQQGLGLTTSSASFVAGLATLTLAAAILGAGALGDALGRRRMFMLGLAGSAVFGVLAAAAPNAAVLMVARGLSGVSFAFLLGLSLAILTAVFPPERRAAAIGLYLAAAFLTTAPQPALGGLLVESTSWRAGFLVAPVVALLTLALTWTFVPEVATTGGRRLDVPGIALGAVMLVSLVYGISRLATGVDAAALLPIAAGLLAGVGFVLWERRCPQPALDLRLFRSGPFNSAVAAGAAFNLVTGGSTILVTYYLVAVRDDSTATLGLLLLPASLVQAAAAVAAGRGIAVLGDRTVMICGLVLIILGLVTFALLRADAPLVLVLLVLVCSAIGNALTQTPQSNIMMSFAPKDLAGAVAGVKSGIGQTFYSLGPVLFTLLGSALFTGRARQTLADNGVSAQELTAALRPTGGGTADSSGGTGVLDPSSAAQVADLVRDELLGAMRITALVVCLVPLLAIAVTLRFLPKRLEQRSADKAPEPASPA